MISYDIKQIENLVNKMADSYDYPDGELVSQMNKLTGNDWDAKTYWEYTCEYWSHNSLEETVYALINGDYPPQEECEYYVWNAKFPLNKIMTGADSSLSDIMEETHLFFRLGRYRKDKKKSGKFNDLPLDKIYSWLTDNFSKRNFDISEQNDEDIGSLSLSANVEYGIGREILVFPYEKKCLRISFINIQKEDIEKVLEFLKPLSTDIFQQN